MNHKPKVMIVDDEPSKRKMLGRLLHDQYDISYATSGSEALATAPGAQPDIILLDINMPQMNGFEICTKLREIESLKLSKIIIVSGRAFDEDKKHGIESGANDYISLPFDETEFKLRVNNMVKLKNAEEMIVFRNVGGVI